MRGRIVRLFLAVSLLAVGAPAFGAAQKPQNIILIGWDGAQRAAVDKCLGRKELLNLQKLIDRGRYVKIDVEGAVKRGGRRQDIAPTILDAFTLDLSGADVVTFYLLPSLNVKLILQLEKLKPGARIVSHDFDMKGVKPDQTVKVTTNDSYVSHTVYLWTCPLKKTDANETDYDDDN